MTTETTTNPRQAAIIEKIRKLLALATSANEHEAAAAAAKAADLLDQYNLDMADLQEKPEAIGEHNLPAADMIPLWIANLATVTAEHFNCKCLISKRRPQGSWKTVQIIKFIGTPTDTAILEYVFTYLQRTIKNIAERTPTPPGMNTRRFRESFKIGAVMGLQEKLRDIRRASAGAPAQQATVKFTTTGAELVTVKRDALAMFIRDKYPRIKNSSNGYRPSATGYHAGAAAGRNININAGINQGNGTRRIA